MTCPTPKQNPRTTKKGKKIYTGKKGNDSKP